MLVIVLKIISPDDNISHYFYSRTGLLGKITKLRSVAAPNGARLSEMINGARENGSRALFH
jgi:hypothetical protein